MEKLGVIAISVLCLGTVLSMVGRFTPGIFRSEGILSVTDGKVVNASSDLSYYYLRVCDEGTDHCYFKTFRERYEELKTIHSISTLDWIINRNGEMVIDILCIASSVCGCVLAVMTCVNADKRQHLSPLVSTSLLIAATLQLANLSSLFAELLALEKQPLENSKVLFPYSVPLIVIGSVCLLATAMVFYFKMFYLLLQSEQRASRQNQGGNFSNIMNVPAGLVVNKGNDVDGTSTKGNDVTLHSEMTSL